MMGGVSGAPLFSVWFVALVLAVVAPWCARALQATFEARLRRRTIEVIARARPPESRGAPAEAERPGGHPNYDADGKLD
jgi:hypothetical protein